MSNKILLKRSNALNADGTVKLPTESQIDYGEIAVNYNKGHETLSIKNSSNEVVTFSPDSDIDTLTEAPTSSTLIGLDGKPYKIGDEVRVTDSSFSSGYKTYVLMDINSNGEAVWANNSNKITTNGDYSNVYSITFDMEVTEPHSMITSGGTRDVIEWIRSNSHRYLCKYVKSEDMMYICQLDDNDSTKFAEDGSSANLNGQSGDVFMKLPKFYYKSVKIPNTHNNYTIYFALDNIDGTFKEWHGNDFIAAFKAWSALFEDYDSNINDYYYHYEYRLRSCVPNTSVGAININREIEGVGDSLTERMSFMKRAYEINKFDYMTWQQCNMMIFLYFAYYCNTDSKNQLGYYYNRTATPGKQLNMIDTNKYNGSGTSQNNFWGLESFFNNCEETIGNASLSLGSLKITEYDQDTYENIRTRLTTATNCINYKYMLIGEFLDAVPYDTTSGNTDNISFCSSFTSSQTNNLSYMVNHGYNNFDRYNGLATFTGNFRDDTVKYTRLSFVGTYKEVSVSEFNAIRDYFRQ